MPGTDWGECGGGCIAQRRAAEAEARVAELEAELAEVEERGMDMERALVIVARASSAWLLDLRATGAEAPAVRDTA